MSAIAGPPPFPVGVVVNHYYSRIDPLTNAAGQPTDLITPGADSVTVSGITDAGAVNNATIQVYLFSYGTVSGLPGKASVAAVSAPVTATDLHETDTAGNELYSWTANLPTKGLAAGIYALESFVDTTGILQTGTAAPETVQVAEDNIATVTVDEFVPFTYVVQDNTELVTVGAAQSDTAVLLSGANATVQLSTDGRYAVWTSGDTYEQDLQTGAISDLTATDQAAPSLAANHSPSETSVGSPDPYGPENEAGYEAITYPSFVEGGVTFSSTPDFDFNANNGSENPLPTVTDASGNTAVLAPFGTSPTMVGYATAASDNGNAVLTVDYADVSYFTPYDSSGTIASPQYYITYRSPAPTLTLAAVNGSNQFSAQAKSVTLSGTSNAIGQTVEIDFQQAGIAVGTATVQADGTWTYRFDPDDLTGSSLFIEASVSSAAGTPAETSETAQITTLPLPTLTSITGHDENDSSTFGPTETLTITLNTSEAVTVTGAPTLTLSNGAVATYSGGSGTGQIVFAYVPAIGDAGSADLAVTGLNLPSGASIGDADGDALSGPFTQSLGLALITAPAIAALSPASSTSDFLTNLDEPSVTVGAEAGDTITLYDDGTAIGSGVAPDYGEQGITYSEIAITTALPEGDSTLTAVATDGSGNSSPLSAPVTITVDTVPPAERVLSLAINGTDTVDLTHQAALSITITGRLDSPLQAGETVVVVLPDGQTQTITPAAGLTGFSITADAFQAEAFGVGGTVSAYVVDAAGSESATTTQAYTADSLRVITLVSADPTDLSAASESAPALSGDGKLIAMEVQAAGGEGAAIIRADDATAPVTSGVYTENLTTHAVTLQAAGAGEAALSSDGTVLAFVQQDSYPGQLYVKNLTTGAVTLVSANNGDVADNGVYAPSLSASGSEVAFLSDADNLVKGIGTGESNDQVYLATLSGGAVASLEAISIATADGTQGNGTSSDVSLSGDGSDVAFASTSSNLLAASDAHTANLGGYNEQIYVKAVTADPASGLAAGEMELVTGNADGSVGDGDSFGTALSANGRYLAFISTSDNLNPANLPPGTVLPRGVAQVYVKDLLTGTLSLVSQTPNGIVGDYAARNVSISGDGQTVVFTDSADNFGGSPVNGTQVYEATLSAGVVTKLTLVSEPGAIPGDGQTAAAALSADGTTVTFQSSADNLVAGVTAGAYGTPHVYTAAIAPAAPPATQPVGLVVTNTNDSGAGSLRAALAAAHAGDTITFAAAIAGGTIALASSLTVATGVTIDGLGSTITVSGNSAVTVFNVALASDQTALIEGLTIADGAATGAAGANATDSGYTSPGMAAAGAIDLSQGELSLLQDSFVSNTATGGGGGNGDTLNNEAGDAGGAAGGAILAGAGTALFGSGLSFSHNMATGGAGGIAQDKATGGTGGTAGGAIYAEQGATISLTNITLDNNTAVGGDGGINVFEGASGLGGNAAGGLYVAGDATVSGSGASFTADTGTGGNGGQNHSNQIGYKAAGLAGNAAGAIYAENANAITPVNFAYSGDSAATGYDGQGTLGSAGAPESEGDSAGNSTNAYAYAYTDTNLTAPSLPAPPGSTGEDGYIVGATVSYVNGSGTPVTTDAMGGFTLTGGTGPIMLTGGKDSATGLAFTGTLTAPAGSTIISPLTTLVQAVALAAGDTSAAGIAAANALVLQSLNLPVGVDLTRFDAEGSLLNSGLSPTEMSAASAVFEADNYLGSADALVAAAGGSPGTTMTAIAQTLASGQAIDLTDPQTLFATTGLSTAATSAIVDIANATIKTVQTQIGTGGAGSGDIFQAVSGASIADQGDAATQLSKAATTGTDAAFDATGSSVVASLPQTIATDDGLVPCYARGTRIETEDGPIAVEDLDVGDLVLTLDGSEPVTWIGFREVRCSLHPEPWKVYPVCIQAGAFGKSQPRRDLLLSPDHAIFHGDVLIPVKHLINGSTIRQIKVETVSYYHVELSRHAVLLAEGLAAESYLDTGDRHAFEDSFVTQLHPAWGSEARDITLLMDASGYAPLRVTGHEIEQVRAIIAEQARRLREGRLA